MDCALGSLGDGGKGSKFIMKKAVDIRSHPSQFELPDDIEEKTVVFADGVSALDIHQGQLGDCYLLSAMSVIAHTRPALL